MKLSPKESKKKQQAKAKASNYEFIETWMNSHSREWERKKGIVD
jgi:hypothetical protein